MRNHRLVILDYGVGNLRNLERAFAHLGIAARISSDPEVVHQATHLVLPGVGAFGAAMDELRSRGLEPVVRSVAQSGVPLLGVCVGFQMLFETGHEFGRHAGLGLLAGEVLRFPAEVRPVPHVGWNQVIQTQTHPLWKDIPDGAFFYFVHSYYAAPQVAEQVLGGTDYGVRYASAVARDNVMGVQFHPEKSHQVGLRLLHNFASL
ncbi:imidazole glycerol phosphate synthase subunit HisH [Chloracidobacterium sp. MS 40/45]|uniref:imidazole glycerol phosphate synthase subunit HisH n=1 Tax=Chloracidobacterium aggregatum TaxID=2851959 RepID=UPI001B8AAA77|nr:imidazole glycerol phosphate synthase subunit HisH [Chloracidobacterium aggregatum]QUW00191.1 imidazole glycerol phosphate synthase subunit HisH [Chloracidobacterium sp. MS 40/45]